MPATPSWYHPTLAENQPGLATLPATGFALLLALAGLWMLAIPHYDADGTNLLASGDFDSAAGWQASDGVVIDAGAAILGARGPGNLTLTQRIAARPGTMVQVTAVASLDRVERGPMRWQSARIELFARNPGGKWAWDFDNTLLKAIGSVSVQRYSAVFELPSKYDEFRVEAHLIEATGVFRIDSLEVKLIEPRSLVHAVCLGFGILTGLIMFGALFSFVPNRLVLGLGLALVLLLFLPAIRDTLRDAISGLQLSVLASSQLFTVLEGFAHFAVVSLLAGMVLTSNRFTIWSALTLLPLSAWHLEAVQHLLPGRQLSLVDAGVNVAAALAAVCWWWLSRTQRAQSAA